MSVNEKRDKNIKSVLQLTKIGTLVMFFACALSIIFGYYICYYTWDIGVIGENSLTGFGSDTVAFVLYTLDFYICVCFAVVILIGVWKLVSNLEANEVFVRANTKLLNLITFGCLGITAFCFIGGIVSLSTVIIGVVALFMGLIVQCVKVLMDKAIDIKEELDLTI